MFNDQSLNFFLGVLIAVVALTKINNLTENPDWQQQIFDLFTYSTHSVQVGSTKYKPQAALILEAQIAGIRKNSSNAGATQVSILQFSLGRIYQEAGLHDEALEQYHQARADADSTENVDVAGKALAAIADVHLSKGQVHEAQQELEQNGHIMDPNSEGGLQALRALVRARLLSGHQERALVKLSKALEMVRATTGSRETEAVLLSEIGEAHQSRGYLRKAQENLEQALRLQESASAGNELALTYTRLGRTLHKLGDTTEALTFHRKALQIQEAVGHFGVLAEIHCDLARAQRDSNAGLPVAIASVKRAEVLLQGKESSIEWGSLASLKSDLLHSNGQLVEAEVYARQAIYVLQGALGDRETPQVASAHNTLGRILITQRRFSDALEHHRQALVIDLKTHGLFHTGTASSYSGMGEAYERLGNGGAAKHCFDKRAEIESRLK